MSVVQLKSAMQLRLFLSSRWTMLFLRVIPVKDMRGFTLRCPLTLAAEQMLYCSEVQHILSLIIPIFVQEQRCFPLPSCAKSLPLLVSPLRFSVCSSVWSCFENRGVSGDIKFICWEFIAVFILLLIIISLFFFMVNFLIEIRWYSYVLKIYNKILHVLV